MDNGSRTTRGRLIFDLDATESSQETWDRACQLQSEMFAEAAAELDVQLSLFREFPKTSR